MIAYKNMPKAVSIMMTVAVIICIGVTALSQKAVEVLGQSGITMQYPSELFDTDEIIRINIQMKEEEWEDMLANASAEEYYACDIKRFKKKNRRELNPAKCRSRRSCSWCDFG